MKKGRVIAAAPSPFGPWVKPRQKGFRNQATSGSGAPKHAGHSVGVFNRSRWEFYSSDDRDCRPRLIDERIGQSVVQLPEQGCDLFLHTRQIQFNCVPHDLRIDPKIIVNQNVTHADYFRPRYVGRRGADFLRQEAGRFTDDLEMPDEPVLKKFHLLRRLRVRARRISRCGQSHRVCPVNARERLSQPNGLFQNPFANAWLKTALRHDVDITAE